MALAVVVVVVDDDDDDDDVVVDDGDDVVVVVDDDDGEEVVVVDDDEGNAVHHTPINPSKVRNTEFCFVSEAQIVLTTPAGQIGMLIAEVDAYDDCWIASSHHDIILLVAKSPTTLP